MTERDFIRKDQCILCRVDESEGYGTVGYACTTCDQFICSDCVTDTDSKTTLFWSDLEYYTCPCCQVQNKDLREV